MANNYTGTIESEVVNPSKLNWRELRAAKFTPPAPFQLDLVENQFLLVEKIIRVIPQRRMVVYGIWKGKSVVAKLFFDPHARRHSQKEVEGLNLLRENKIPTPPLLYNGISRDSKVYVLIFRRIFESKNLQEIWREKESIDELLPLMKAVVVEIATQHVLGILQHDMHLKNFLLTQKTLFSLDGAKVERFSELLPRKLSINHIALFLSQLGIGLEAFQEKLFHHYAKSRGWLLKKEDMQELSMAMKRWNEERWRQYEKKIFRECTDYVCIKDLGRFVMVERERAKADFLSFLRNPDAIFNHPATQILKAGRSTTVAKVTLDHQDFVIKRYNIKGIWHFLRRCFRPTRAFTCWRLAQKLNLFGINTAKPVAFIETKHFGLRGKSYYVTEYVQGEHAGEFFARYEHEKLTPIINSIATLLKNIAKLEITHGDLKITNILINQHEQPVLIDLDGATEHNSSSSLRSSWRREIKRFLQNFQEQPELAEKFKAELKQ